MGEDGVFLKNSLTTFIHYLSKSHHIIRGKADEISVFFVGVTLSVTLCHGRSTYGNDYFVVDIL